MTSYSCNFITQHDLWFLFPAAEWQAEGPPGGVYKHTLELEFMYTRVHTRNSDNSSQMHDGAFFQWLRKWVPNCESLSRCPHLMGSTGSCPKRRFRQSARVTLI